MITDSFSRPAPCKILVERFEPEAPSSEFISNQNRNSVSLHPLQAGDHIKKFIVSVHVMLAVREPPSTLTGSARAAPTSLSVFLNNNGTLSIK
jgi:hypothetical protein